ncbi:hypothetical protein [Corallococcus exercitus]|uniref:Uncharacterized protein n=1 Tax=Corallococcus exercitus TaxID=2316736 RepID=A0A7Y4JQV2_9BACT|nr:hypothetical protein [Corallococcus exercitus]NOK08552.1 hypothetical protein [Corallococcus exercitus]
MKTSTPRTKVAEGLRALVSAEDILEAARRLGVLQRQRKVDLVALVESPPPQDFLRDLSGGITLPV